MPVVNKADNNRITLNTSLHYNFEQESLVCLAVGSRTYTWFFSSVF